VGQDHQTSCPTGTTTQSTGSTSSASCVPLYGFGGFISPLSKSTLAKSGSTIPVKFMLTVSSSSGTAISASLAAALGAGGKVKATLTGPGISPQVAVCTWYAPGLNFQCNINTPKTGLLTGTNYTITVSEAVGTGFVIAPAVGSASNPVTVTFK
jgi:hypothetical protein